MSAKLDFYHQKLAGRANILREHLEYLEDVSVDLGRRNRDKILEVYGRLDEVQSLFEALKAGGGPDLRPELVQFDGVMSRLFDDAGLLLYRLGGPERLRAIRPQTARQDTHPWWFFDQIVAQRRVQQTRRLIRIGGTIGAVLLVIVILLNTVFKPDPALVESKNFYDSAISEVTNNNDYEAALIAVNQSLTIRPDSLETLVLKGVILEALDEPEEAAELYAQAETLSPSPELISVGRARILLQFNQFEPALVQAQRAIDLNPESAHAWFVAGQAHERLGDLPLALQEMETASDLAFEQGDQTLYAIIRVNMGYLMPGGAQ